MLWERLSWLALVVALASGLYRARLPASARPSAMPQLRQPQWIMLGDSITQQAWLPAGTGATLQDLYQRKMYVKALLARRRADAAQILKRDIPN